MPSVSRQGDYCSGHECYPPRTCIDGSPTVYVNNRGWHRKGDNWSFHKCGKHVHDGTLSKGSSTVFVNSVSGGRIGDPVSCGSAVAQGSPNVFCGG